MMDVSDLRKRILRALDEASQDVASKRPERTDKDASNRAFDDFLEKIAVPLLRQAQSILKAEREMFTVHAPAGSAKLASDTTAQTFLEITLDLTSGRPLVVGRTSRAKGGQRVVVDERPVSTTKTIVELTDEDVAAFLVTEIPKLVKR